MKTNILFKKSNLLLYCCLLVSIVVFLLILFDNCKPDYYRYLFILPLSFALLIITMRLMSVKPLCNWFALIPFLLYFLRNVVTPLFMRFGNYYGSFKKLTLENVNNGLFLMIFETVIVLLFVTIKAQKLSFEREKTKRNETSITVSSNYNFVFFLSIVVGLVFCGLALFVPPFSTGYISIFSKEGLRDIMSNGAGYQSGTSSRIAVTLFQVIFPLVYMLFSTSLICFLSKLKRIPLTLKNILTFFCIFIPAFFMDGGDGNTFICILCLFLTALVVNKAGKKNIVFFATLTIASIGIYVFIQAMINTLAYKRESLASNLSNMLQAYFPGVCNYAGIFNTGQYDKIQEIFYDIYSCIPFRNTLFGLTGFERLPNLYTIDNDALSHIMPCTGHIFYYVGLLAPIIPCALYSFAFRVYRKIKQTSNPLFYMALCLLFLYLELTPVMYNLVIFGSRFLSQILPLLIVSRIVGKENTIVNNPLRIHNLYEKQI